MHRHPVQPIRHHRADGAVFHREQIQRFFIFLGLRIRRGIPYGRRGRSLNDNRRLRRRRLIGDDQNVGTGLGIRWSRITVTGAVVRIRISGIAPITRIPKVRIQKPAIKPAVEPWIAPAVTVSVPPSKSSYTTKPAAKAAASAKTAAGKTTRAAKGAAAAYPSTGVAAATAPAPTSAPLGGRWKSQQKARDKNRQNSPHGYLTHQYTARTNCARCRY